MNLPFPTPGEVEEFAAWYKREFGVVLNERDSWETATQTLQLFYLGTYGLHTRAPRHPAPDEKHRPSS